MLGPPGFSPQGRIIAATVIAAALVASAIPAEPHNEVTIDGKTFRAHSSHLTAATKPELVVSVSETDFPDLGGVIGGLRAIEIPLSDGQTLLGRRSGASTRTKDGGVWALATFPVLPWHEKELTVRFRYAERDYQLLYENPAYREISQWLPQELPLQWSKGDLSVTLLGIDLVRDPQVRNASVAWTPKFRWSIHWKGRPADEWFHAGVSVVEDPGGNHSDTGGLLGVSAWKLRCSVRRSHSFPFAPDEVRWFGWTRAERFTTLAPGECDLLDVALPEHGAGLRFAGLFGPGEYEFDGSNLVSKSPPQADKPIATTKAKLDSVTGRVRLCVGERQFLHHGTHRFPRGWAEAMRGEDGKPVYLGGGGSDEDGETLWRRGLQGARGQSFQYGIANFGEPQRFELIVKPPQLPK